MGGKGRRQKGPRLYQRGRVWWAWGWFASGERWCESTGCRDRAAAVLVAARLERERAPVDRAEATPLGLEQAFRDVMQARTRERKAVGTLDTYRRSGGHLCRILGAETDVHSLTLADLERYIDQRTSEEAMRSTVAMELTKLKAALSYAAKHGRYRGTISAIWPGEALKGAHVPHERYLTREEYGKLHAALPASRRDHLVAYVFTGARRAEVWKIRRADVDLGASMVRIRGTKSSGSDRSIPIAAELRPAIDRALAANRDPLFPPWASWITLQRACARAGIDPVSPNDLRRTFCSWLAQAGVPLLVTVKLMGHRSAKMVERVYARFGAADLHAAISALSQDRSTRGNLDAP